MSIRIIGGKFRGMRIDAPDSARPTLIRHRQTIFDTLETIEKDRLGRFFEDKIVMDCFAGSGALGIEAISRGAKMAYMIDQNHQAIALLHQNTEKISEQFKIIRSDLLKLRNSDGVVCDAAFIDPPYGKISMNKIISYLFDKKWISERTWLILEEDAKNIEVLENCKVIVEKISGNSSFRFVKYSKKNISAIISSR